MPAAGLAGGGLLVEEQKQQQDCLATAIGPDHPSEGGLSMGQLPFKETVNGGVTMTAPHPSVSSSVVSPPHQVQVQPQQQEQHVQEPQPAQQKQQQQQPPQPQIQRPQQLQPRRQEGSRVSVPRQVPPPPQLPLPVLSPPPQLQVPSPPQPSQLQRRRSGSVEMEGPATGAGTRSAAAAAAATTTVTTAVNDRVVEELVQENDALRKTLASLRKDYERTNVELKERIRTLQLELEQDRSRVINEVVTDEHAALREIKEALLEATRELPDVIPTRVLGQVSKNEVKQILKASGYSTEHLQEAAAVLETVINDTSYDPFERDDEGQIVSHKPAHEQLFPLRQQYGPAAVELVLLKKKELDQLDDLTPRTVLWADGHEIGLAECVRRLAAAVTESRQSNPLNGVQQGKSGVYWEEWLGFRKGRIGTAPHEFSVIGDDIVDGYKAWVARSRQVSARSADMYLNDLNKIIRLCFRALGLPDESMDHQALRTFCTENWHMIEQEAANLKSKSVDQGINYLKGYFQFDDAELQMTGDDEASLGGSRVPSLAESILEGYSVWLHQNTATKQTTWRSYGRAIERVMADVLKSSGTEGSMLEPDQIRDFVIEHMEALQKRVAADHRRFVGSCFRYFLRFLGLLEVDEEEEAPIRRDEGGGAAWEQPLKESSTPRGSGKAAVAARSSYGRRTSDRLPLDIQLADAYGRYLVKKGGMKEGTSIEYVRYVGTWINDLVDMDDIDVPPVDTLDKARMVDFVTANEEAIRKYGQDLKRAVKKGKVSAWRHFMIFLGLAGPEEDWITGKTLNKAPTLRASFKASPDGVKNPPCSGILDSAVRSSFAAYLLDKQQGPGVAQDEVKAYVTSAERSLKACIKAESEGSTAPFKEGDEIRAFLKEHTSSIEQYGTGLKKKPRMALGYLLDHLGVPHALGPVAPSPSSKGQAETSSAELVEPTKEGPLGVALVTSFAAWLRGEAPLTNSEVQDICKAVGSIMAQAYHDAGVQEEGNELLSVEAAQAFMAGQNEVLVPVVNALSSRHEGIPWKELALFKSFVERASSRGEEGVAAAGGGGMEEVVGSLLMDEFAAEAVERGLSGQLAALQVLHVLSQVRRQGEAATDGQGQQLQQEYPLQGKEEVLRYLTSRRTAVNRLLLQAPYHTEPLDRFLAFLGADDTSRQAFFANDGGWSAESNTLSVSMSADLLLWLVEYRAMTIVQAEFVIRALDRLIAHLGSTEVTGGAAAWERTRVVLGLKDVGDLLAEKEEKIGSLVQSAADQRFRTAYSLFCLYHFKEDLSPPDVITLGEGNGHRQDDDDQEMDDDDPWGLAGQEIEEDEIDTISPWKGISSSDGSRPVMSEALATALAAHLMEEFGAGSNGLVSACTRQISIDLGAMLASSKTASSKSRAARTMKTKEDLRKFVTIHASQVKARRSASTTGKSAWDAVLSYLHLTTQDLVPPPSKRSVAGGGAAKKVVVGAKKSLDKVAPPFGSAAARAPIPRKSLTVPFRKDFKRFMRTRNSDLGRDTRKFYSDLICEVLRVVMVKKGKGDLCVGDMNQAKKFVTQYSRDINLACDTYAKSSSWTNFQAFLGIAEGSLDAAKKGGRKEAGTATKAATAMMKRSGGEGKRKSGEDGEGEGADGQGKKVKAGDSGVKKRKRKLSAEGVKEEEHDEEDDEDDDMDGDDEGDLPGGSSSDNESDSRPRRKRKRQEVVLDPKLSSDFEAWLHSTKGITSGTCYSGWVRQLLRRVMETTGKRLKMLKASDLPAFLVDYKEQIDEELSLPRKDGRNSAWRHFLTFTTGESHSLQGKGSKGKPPSPGAVKQNGGGGGAVKAKSAPSGGGGGGECPEDDHDGSEMN